MDSVTLVFTVYDNVVPRLGPMGHIPVNSRPSDRKRFC